MSARNKKQAKKDRRAKRGLHQALSLKKFPPLFLSVPKSLVKGQQYLTAQDFPHDEKIAALVI